MIIPVRCFSCGKPIGHLWEDFKKRVAEGEHPKKVLDDVFNLLDKITRKIISALAVKLNPREHNIIAGRHTDKIEAYDNFLKG